MWVAIVIGSILYTGTWLFIYSMCKAASIADEQMESSFWEDENNKEN